ncbi:MAG: phosphatase PAP2 family protein [Chloroflexota bacterium]|nr:phosphatase PAP2 family protein [Chloroflexota bacterium]
MIGRGPTPLLVAAAAILACLGLGVLVSLDMTRALDDGVSAAILAGHSSALGRVAATWETVGDLTPWILISWLVGLALFVSGRRLAAVWFFAAITADGLAALMKAAFALPRPPGGDLIDLFGGPSYAYPSGHVARTVVLLGLLAWVTLREVPRPRRPLVAPVLVVAVVVGVAMMGVARIGAGQHWASDVLGGALVGVAWLAFVMWLDRRARGSP